MLFHMNAKAAKGEQKKGSNSVQKLVRSLKVSPFERKMSARSLKTRLGGFRLRNYNPLEFKKAKNKTLPY